jgi:NitT/TauT family transport system substrate-binding protein
MKWIKSRAYATLAFFILPLVVSACAATPPPPVEKTVTVQLSWVHSIEFAGFYDAVANNDYAQEGLKVNLLPGLDDSGNFYNPIDEVTSGRADFGVMDGGVLLTERAKGTKVVAIATIYQRHPLAFTSFADKNITRPQDLVGHSVLVNLAISGVAYNAMLVSAGVDPTKVNTIDRTSDFTEKPLIDGKADVLGGWVTDEVVALNAQGYKINTILVSDYGVEMYPDVIFTTEDKIAQDPDLVLGFVRATVKGTQSAIDDPDGAAALALTYGPTLKLDEQKAAMAISLPLLKPAGSQAGAMTDSAWKSTYQILQDQKILTAPLDVTQAYTLTFLNQVYANK